MNLPNVIKFKINKTPVDYKKDSLLTKWLRDTNSATWHQLNGIWFTGRVGAISIDIASYAAGKYYHSLIVSGFITHVSGFDFANHFIKMPVSFMAEIYETKEVTDPDTGEVSNVNITNEEHYNVLINNDTNCLVKITDVNYNELKPLIDPLINIIAEDKYLIAISEGGEFYVEPKNV